MALKPLSNEDECNLYIVFTSLLYFKKAFFHIRTDANVLLPRPS